jgi:hypothetical protein
MSKYETKVLSNTDCTDVELIYQSEGGPNLLPKGLDYLKTKKKKGW